ncbi:MAG: ATP-binding protein [Candidatus Thermoplasmatota archaeon]|nr:ATP-binding protein [Candidatus Thermoplasmatota archaeon]
MVIDQRKETVTREDLKDLPGDPVGVVFGNVGSNEFRCVLLDSDIKELDHVQVEHPTEGWVLGMIDKVELRSDLTHEGALMNLFGKGGDVTFKRVATVSLIGARNQRNVLARPLTPILPSSKVFRPEPDLLKSTLGLALTREQGVYLGKVLNTEVDVVLSPNDLVQRHLSIIAKSGSGKSYACGVLTEELNRLNIPVVIMDLHGEYRSLIAPNTDGEDYRRMGRFAVKPKGLGKRLREFTFSEVDIVGEQPSPLGIDIRGFRAEDLLELMGLKNIGYGTSVLYNALNKVTDILGDDWEIFDLVAAVQTDNNPAKWNILNGLEHLARLPFFKNPPTPLVEIVVPGKVTVIELKEVPLDIQQIGAAALLRRLFNARKDCLIPPFMLVVEEAHNFCPQSGPAITSSILRTIASEGRKFGLGLTVVSQRPAKVDKNVLSQCGTQVLLKVTNPNDIKAVIASFEGLDARMSDEIQNLPVAVAIVVGGNISTPVLVEVRTRSTRHGGDAVDIMGEIDRRMPH